MATTRVVLEAMCKSARLLSRGVTAALGTASQAVPSRGAAAAAAAGSTRRPGISTLRASFSAGSTTTEPVDGYDSSPSCPPGSMIKGARLEWSDKVRFLPLNPPKRKHLPSSPSLSLARSLSPALQNTRD